MRGGGWAMSVRRSVREGTASLGLMRLLIILLAALQGIQWLMMVDVEDGEVVLMVG